MDIGHSQRDLRQVALHNSETAGKVQNWCTRCMWISMAIVGQPLFPSVLIQKEISVMFGGGYCHAVRQTEKWFQSAILAILGVLSERLVPAPNQAIWWTFRDGSNGR